MVARGQHDKLIVEKGVNLDVQIFRRKRHHIKVVLVVAEAFDDPVSIRDLQLDGNVGVAAAEATQHAREEILGGGDQGNAQLAASEPAHGVDGGLESVPDIVEAAGGGQQFLTRRCQARGATGLVEKRHSYGVGELSDLDGDRRLCQVQRFGSTRETAQAGDGGKGLKLAEGDAAAGHCISFDLWLFIKYFI